jgi:hypothetical protein
MEQPSRTPAQGAECQTPFSWSCKTFINIRISIEINTNLTLDFDFSQATGQWCGAGWGRLDGLVVTCGAGASLHRGGLSSARPSATDLAVWSLALVSARSE